MSNNRDLELLSAYADGELSDKERLEIEQKLKLSPEFQEELEKLCKLKAIVSSSARELPESPFFDTRVMAAVHNDTGKSRSLKWIPAAGFGVVTVLLMFVFRYNPDVINNIVKEQHSNLAGFYKENLRPLLFSADLTNEDIFNFAFYHRLPLDKNENQVLQLGYSGDGKEFFEIKKNHTPAAEGNYEKFLAVLNLNPGEKRQMDSILESYKDELEMQILANEKHTVAINPNLWNYNKAIAADLISFAKEANMSELAKILPSDLPSYSPATVRKIVAEVKSVKPAEFIFITPDTIFSEEYSFDKQKMRKEIKKMREELKYADNEMKRNFAVTVKVDGKITKMQREQSKNFNIYIDSNMCHVQLAGVNVPTIPFPDFKEMGVNIEQVTRRLEYLVSSFPKSRNDSRNFSIRIDSGSSKGYNFNFNMPNLDSVAHYVPMQLDSMVKFYSKNFNHRVDKNLDSLVTGNTYKMKDNDYFWQNEAFRKQMEEMQKEMTKFREEMENLRKDMKKDNGKQQQKKKPVEI
jgi:DNA-binding protein YbaB